MQCHKCGKMVYWGAKTCQHCGCEAPTSQKQSIPMRPIYKITDPGGGEEKGLTSGWWWVVFCLLIAGAFIIIKILGLFGLNKIFPIDPGMWK